MHDPFLHVDTLVDSLDAALDAIAHSDNLDEARGIAHAALNREEYHGHELTPGGVRAVHLPAPIDDGPLPPVLPSRTGRRPLGTPWDTLPGLPHSAYPPGAVDLELDPVNPDDGVDQALDRVACFLGYAVWAGIVAGGATIGLGTAWLITRRWRRG